MATKPRFKRSTIPRYLFNEPALIQRLLGEQGPTAASKAARFYSMALCLAAFVVFFLMSCALGFFQVQATRPDGILNLADGRVLASAIPVGVVLILAVLAAIWAAALGILAVASPNEPKGPAVSALLWGIALVILYGGVAAGLMGFPS